MSIIIERTNNPIYVCNVDGRVDAVEYRARVGKTEIARFSVQREGRPDDELLPMLGEIIGSVIYYLPMLPPRGLS